MTDGLGLGDAYGATLGRIKGQGGEKAKLGMACLMWISHAKRPLKLDELCHALAVDIGSSSLSADNVPSIGTLLSCCQGLVVIDKETSIVRLIHFTLHEYLRAHPEFSGPAHPTMAETCLSYLNSQQIRALSTSTFPDLGSTPFLEYSSVYWGTHAKRDLSDCAKSLALKLFDNHNNSMPTRILLKSQGHWEYHTDSDKLCLFGGLHWASVFGIDDIVAVLVEVEGCDINQIDCIGNTPLVWAAKNGHEGVVNVLLRRGDVDPNKSGSLGQTPLYLVAENGHEGVVKIFLGRSDINLNKPDTCRRTPLWCAAENGWESIVKMILRWGDVNPNEPGWCGQTPLWCAARNGREEVVKILLGRSDVDPNKPDIDGRTPLLYAAWNGH